ncbi:hypothetical protein CF336_g5563 [Tilletia laevis]|nr:hypothetical protein CF336_g5563 [Tilletia laevis]KAE8196044.1 hypothetical protein CF335_g4950 [Tilletia laevis]
MRSISSFMLIGMLFAISAVNAEYSESFVFDTCRDFQKRCLNKGIKNPSFDYILDVRCVYIISNTQAAPLTSHSPSCFLLYGAACARGGLLTEITIACRDASTMILTSHAHSTILCSVTTPVMSSAVDSATDAATCRRAASRASHPVPQDER